MKLAILILAHNKPKQLAYLLSLLKHPDVGVFLHLDKRSDQKAFETAFIAYNVKPRYITQKEHIIYSSIRYIYASLDLMREAYRQNYEYYCLISGQDLPLKPIEDIISFFEANKERNYIEYKAFPVERLPYGGATRYEYYNYLIGEKMETLFPWKKITHNMSFQGKILNFLLSIRSGFKYHRTYPLQMDPYYSSQWWNINRNAMQVLLNFADKNPGFLGYHKHALHPEEMFFQTILLNQPELQIVNDNLRYIEWKAGNKHPEQLQINHLDKISLQTDAIFARKFTLDENQL